MLDSLNPKLVYAGKSNEEINADYSLELIHEQGGGLLLNWAIARFYINARYFGVYPDLRDYDYLAFHIRNQEARPQNLYLRLRITYVGGFSSYYVRMRKIYMVDRRMSTVIHPQFCQDDREEGAERARFRMPESFDGWCVVPLTSYNISSFASMTEEGCLELLESEGRRWQHRKRRDSSGDVIPFYLEFAMVESPDRELGSFLVDRLHFASGALPLPGLCGDRFPQPAQYPRDEITEEDMYDIFDSMENSASLSLVQVADEDWSGSGVVFRGKGYFWPARRGVVFLKSPQLEIKAVYPYRSSCIRFNQADGSRNIFLTNILMLQMQEEYLWLASMFDRISEAFKTGQCSDYFEAKGLLFQLLGKLYRYAAIERNGVLFLGAPVSLENYEMIERVKWHLEEKCTADITLGELAQMCSVSQEHLCREFKKYTKVTPIEYLVSCRIRKAKKLLENTDWSIARIAEQCGFQTASYFHVAFKKREQMTPKDYRNLYKIYRENGRKE